MRWIALVLVMVCGEVALADGGAQAHADRLGASGISMSRGRIAQRHHATGVGREGLGFSTRSPQDAIRRSCFYGQYAVEEAATAWCPSRGGWIAVVRYKPSNTQR